MNDYPLSRRDVLAGIMKLTGGLALAGGLSFPVWPATVNAENKSAKWIVEGSGQTAGYSIKALTRKMFESAGGVSSFIAKGDVVVIKPNISWAQPPNLAATTHPEVLEAVIELCQEAGAKKIRIADHTIHDAKRCFSVTGAGSVAEKTGAELVDPKPSYMKEMNLKGERLKLWPVFTPLVEADKVINIPVAKVHGLSGLTLGMKNWIGAVGGRRPALHQDIHQTIADLAGFFNPTLTLIDATRVMIANGPSGGDEKDVKIMNRLILSNDPVAADAKAAALFGRNPLEIGFIKIAESRKMGTSDMGRLNQLQVSV
jgi:uncharacterized protein (DUF362 family)